MFLKAKFFNQLTAREVYEIIKSRTEIFILEQNIICQDLDDTDYDSLHCFYEENGRVIAYLRAFYTDTTKDTVKIGRVLTLNHGKGIGKQLMEDSILEIKSKLPCKKISINAQKYATGFYEKFGFKVVSGDFLEEGVVHVKMEKEI